MATAKKSKKNEALLLYGDTRNCADIFYLGNFFVPDAFLAFKIRGKTIAVLNSLEYGRGVKESQFDKVLSMEALLEKSGAKGSADEKLAAIVREVAHQYKVKNFTVSRDFPSGLADTLRRKKVSIGLTDNQLLPDREIKNEKEIAALRQGCRASAAGIRAAERILRASKIKSGKLYYKGKVLTSERVRFEVEVACLEQGAISLDTIVAGGDQGCDPHCRGSGPLRANSLIIVDVFPQITRTGYHGDMTRTFLKGKASDAQRKLVAAVRAAQKIGIKSIKAGVTGDVVHRKVAQYFEEKGYETYLKKDQYHGFFHGTGHGLGLEVHEAPRVSPHGPKLKKGMVVTVEPGLYYPGTGGVRIEDVVCVEKDGCRKLSSYPYQWELS